MINMEMMSCYPTLATKTRTSRGWGSRQHEFISVMLLVGTLSGIQAQSQNASAVIADTTTVENYSTGVFFYMGASGSVILSGSCVRSPDGDVVMTDKMAAPSPGSFKRLDDALDNLSLVNHHIVWSRQNDGLVQIRDDRASASMLRLPIKQVQFKDAVSLQGAVDQLMLAPEIKVFLDKNRIEMPIVYSSAYLWNQTVDKKLSASAAAPKYSQLLTNVTLEKALNSIVRIFPGEWTYSECPGRITITTNITGSPRRALNSALSPQ
jgi:hypothetical protein